MGQNDDKLQQMITNQGTLEALLSDGKGQTHTDFESIFPTPGQVTESYVRITEDKTEAWLYLVAKPDHSDYTKPELLNYLQTQGVISGFMMSNISAMAKKRVYDREIKVAVSSPPEEGKNGYYEYFFDANTKREPQIRSDGTVDYQSINLLQNVTEGSILCLYHPAVQGKDGLLVDGTVIRPDPVKDLPQIKGKGFIITENGLEYRSTVTGKLDFSDGKITISSVFEVRGDVTQLTGNVKFDGDVVIYGSVDAGLSVTAGRTLTIEGTVAGASIIAGNDIVLKRGVQGAGKGSIIAGGSVFADFIEHAHVEAGGNVESNTILSSVVKAGAKVVLTGKRGLVIGGYVHGLDGVEAVNAGNDAEVKTILHAGMESEDHEKNLELMKTDGMLREKASELITKMKRLMNFKKIRELTDSEEKEIVLLNREKDELVKLITDNRSEMENMNRIVEHAARAQIKIQDKLNRGVIIAMNNQRLLIENTTAYMSYQNVRGVIVGTVIVRN